MSDLLLPLRRPTSHAKSVAGHVERGPKSRRVYHGPHTQTLKLERSQARRQIIKAANAHRGPFSTRLLNMRQIGEAVHVVRKYHLVSDDVLATAGWR